MSVWVCFRSQGDPAAMQPIHGGAQPNKPKSSAPSSAIEQAMQATLASIELPPPTPYAAKVETKPEPDVRYVFVKTII